MSQIKQTQHKVKLQFIDGVPVIEKDFLLPIGFVSHAVAYTNDVDVQNGVMLSLALKDDENLELIPAVNIKNWQQRSGGTYLDSLKPLGFDTMGRTYKLVCSQTSKNQASNIEVDVYFFYNS